jgi:TP901 family phage tail tape measure protein
MANVLAFTLQIDGLGTVNDLKKAIKETTEALNDKQIDSPEYKKLQKSLAELKAAQKALNQETRYAADASRFAVGSYDEMNARLGALRRQYKELGSEERNSPIGKETVAQIQLLDEELKRIDATIGNFQRNVGNYTGAYDKIKQQVELLRKEYKNLGVEYQKTKIGEDLRAQINLLEGELNQLDNSLNQNTQSVNRLGGAYNNLTTLLGALGIGVGLYEITNATADFSLKLSELQSITGVSGDDLEKLKGSISDLTSITLAGGQVIVNTGSDIAEAFKLAGSARPELLGNIDALQEFTKNAIVFAKSGGLPVQDAITSLSSVLAQFGRPASDAALVMNELAAGSKAGASEIKDTAAAIEQFGAGAASANVKTAEAVALVETLADKFIVGSEAGTKIRNILTTIKAPQGLDAKAQEQLRKYGVSFEVLSNTALPLSDRLKELSKIQGDANALIQVFGKENVTAGEILLQNVGRFDELTTAVTGTNEAFIQAGINADNLAQLISNAKAAATNLAVGIGTTLYNAVNVMLGALSALSTFIDENKVALLAAGFAVAAYATTLNSTRLVLLSFQAAQVANTVVTNVQAVAQKGLALATAAVPYVAVGIAIFGLVKAMQQWFGATDEQIKTQEILLDSQKQLTEAYASEAQSAAELFAIAKSDVSSKEQKAAAAKRIIELYPEYLGGIKTETELLNRLDEVQKNVNKGILEGAIARIKKQKIDEANNSLVDLELKKQQLLFDFQQKGIDANSGFAASALSQLQGNIDETKKRIADLPTFLSKVGEGLSNQNIDFTGISVSDNQIKEVQKQIIELNAFRFNLIQTTGKDLDEEGKKRYDFLLGEEKRLRAERQKLIDSNLKGEQVAAQKSVSITVDAEAQKDTIKSSSKGKAKEAETLDELNAKLKELQAQLSGLSGTPSKIPSSLLDDISKTKKEIDELEKKLKALFDKPLEGIAKTRAEAAGSQTIDLSANTDQAEKDLKEYLDEKDKLNRESIDKQNTDDLAAQKELLDLKAANDKAAAEKEAEQRKQVQSELYSNALSFAKDLSSAILNIQSDELKREADAKTAELEAEKQRELDLAGNNATLIQEINERYAAEKIALDRKVFEENKKIQIAQALINGALAATAVFAVPDFTFGIASGIRLAFIAANTALQVGLIARQKFAKGGYVQGEGTGTSDEVPAMLSNGEFVVTAAATEQIGISNLNRMNETKSIPSIAAPQSLRNNQGLNQTDISAIIQAVKEGSYQGTQTGVNDGLVAVNRETNILNKLK